MPPSQGAPDLDYGPLTPLIGSWAGDQGLDVSPEPDGEEHSPYHETLMYEAIGGARNAGSQVLKVLRYQQIVRRKSNNEVFHDQTGYWMWDAAAGIVMLSLAIPRSVCAVAGGQHSGSFAGAAVTLAVRAALGDPDWGIVQSPFMRDKASTKSFEMQLTVDGDRLSYSQTTVVDIYGKTFDHTDRNELRRQA